MAFVPANELSSHIGSETGRSEWFTIDQERVNAFADTTIDHQWIHIDANAAAQGPFGSTIAHGFLTLSLLVHLTSGVTMLPEGAVMYINYGLDKVRFLHPVPVGSRVRAIVVLKDVREKSPGQTLMTNSVTIEIEGTETPALVADTLTLAVMGPQE